ncbi:MAG: nuclear transport factor 2 family protein [Pseudonocardiaceae bacterium]|nr:nuclear transport factor 2 family protein [Pseudonocardiaceae bacterium]
MSATTDEVLDLVQRWSDSELKGDVDALGALVTDDFRLIGPLGFVLPKQAWLGRYLSGDLVNTAFEVKEPLVREYGDAAVVIAVQSQESTYQGNPANGSFRVSLVAVRQDGRLLIAHLQLSSLGAPPAMPGQPPRG